VKAKAQPKPKANVKKAGKPIPSGAPSEEQIARVVLKGKRHMCAPDD
jgi:hypothetical protein